MYSTLADLSCVIDVLDDIITGSYYLSVLCFSSDTHKKMAWEKGVLFSLHIMAYMIEIVAVPVFSSSHADQKY